LLKRALPKSYIAASDAASLAELLKDGDSASFR
jgi:hypothetical protein